MSSDDPFLDIDDLDRGRASGNGLAAAAARAMHSTFGPRGTAFVVPPGPHTAPEQNHKAYYAMLRAMAENTNAYGDKVLEEALKDYGLGETALQGLANPVNAVCQFYEFTVWPGTIREDDDESALPLRLPESAKYPDALRTAIHIVWRLSNLNNIKDGAVYDAALLGDQLYQIVSDAETKRAWFEMIEPEQMSVIETDGRGYLVALRLDAEQVEQRGNASTRYWITRVWDKRLGTERVWMHDKGEAVALSSLGTPTREVSLARAYGVDFVPLVHWRWNVRADDERGVSAVIRAFDKIIYGDAIKTALHQRLGRYGMPDMALTTAKYDREGLPTPAGMGAMVPRTVKVGEGSVLELPPGYSVEWLIANLPYDAHLATVVDHYKALAQTDLSELTYYEVSEAGAAESGRALDYRLTPAKSKVIKARGRAESELIRATQMALTVAQNLKAPGFLPSEIGTYADGDFDFWFGSRPIIPMSPLDDIEVDQSRATVLKTLTDAGSAIEGAVAVAGYSEEHQGLLIRGDVVPPDDADDGDEDEAADGSGDDDPSTSTDDIADERRTSE